MSDCSSKKTDFNMETARKGYVLSQAHTAMSWKGNMFASG